MSQQLERRARVLSGIPAVRDRSKPWWRRFLTSPYLWVSLALAAVFFLCLRDQYLMLNPDKYYEDGSLAAYGLNDEALRMSAFFAMWTAIAWSLLFIWLDRWRPQRPLIWLWVFGWGAAVSTFISIYINSWAGR